MRILVTGAAGFVGYAVATRLVADGYTVTGLTRSPPLPCPPVLPATSATSATPRPCPTSPSTASATSPGWPRSANPVPTRCATGRPTPAACSPCSTGSPKPGRTV